MKPFIFLPLILLMPCMGFSSKLKIVCEQGCDKVQYYAPIDGMYNQFHPTELQCQRPVPYRGNTQGAYFAYFTDR
jgi:hypothetical protein